MVGAKEGCNDGTLVGMRDGDLEGFDEGIIVGYVEGTRVGPQKQLENKKELCKPNLFT